MGVRYEWADDTQIIMNIYIEFPWTWKEYNEAINEIMPILRDLQHPCATVMDLTQMKILPKDGNVLQIMINTDKLIPDNLFVAVLVGTSYSVQIFMNILMKLRPDVRQKTLFAETMDEAHIKIHERYAELYPDMPYE